MFSANPSNNEKVVEQLTDDILKGSYCTLRFFNEFSLAALHEPNPRELAKFVVRTLCFEKFREAVDNKAKQFFLWSTISILFCGNIFQFIYYNYR